MTQDEMFWLAARASYAYHSLYGVFPERVGIHPLWHPLLHHNIHFPLLSKSNPTEECAGQSPPSATHLIHTATFTLHYETSAERDEVWLYHPDATDWMSSTIIFTLAGEPPYDHKRAAQSHPL